MAPAGTASAASGAQCPDAVDADEAAETLDEIAAKVRELHASLATRKKGA